MASLGQVTFVKWLLPIVLAALLVGAATADLNAQYKGSSSARMRKEAAAAIPYRTLRPEIARAIHQVVSDSSIYRRLPSQQLRCCPQMFQFLLRNPEVVAGIWQHLGMTKLQMVRLSPHKFMAVDGMGTTSHFELVYGTSKLHIYRGRGEYEGPLLKSKIRGDCVLVVRSDYGPSRQGHSLINVTLDMFAKLDNGALDIAAGTLYPLFIKAADENFITTSRFVSHLSHAAHVNPTGLKRVAGQLTNVNPSTRSEFVTRIQDCRHMAKAQRTQRIATEVRPQRPQQTVWEIVRE